MKMKKFLINIKFIILLFSIKFLLINTAYSEQLRAIEVFGNERLADETIILFSNLNVGDNIDSNIVNDTFKTLFDTNYFKNLKINIESGILKITVVENPIIQEIIINGIENKSILRELKKITRQSEKYPFVESYIISQKNQLNNIVRMNGFYFANINTQIIDNNNNSINLIYNFDLGDRAKINKINFVGNKIFKTRKLRKIILSEETRPWKFLTKNTYLDLNRVNVDTNLLKKFYKNRGFYDVKIKSSYAEIINNKNFNLTFSIDSGDENYIQ